jgi:uncharacterized membrane protein YczE
LQDEFDNFFDPNGNIMCMFRPVHWDSILRDFIVINFGFALYGLGIALLIQANLGTSPWAILTVALVPITGLSAGVLTMLIGLVVLIGALLMQEQIGWGTVANIVFIGPWLDVFLKFIPSVTTNIVMQSVMFLLAIFIIGIAAALYIGVNAGAGPRDSLMLALERTLGWSLRTARSSIEIIVVIVGWLLGGPLGVGTLVFAVLIGPSVQWAFKILKVQSQINK